MHTISEVEQMHSATMIGSGVRDEWLRLSRLPLRPLVPDDIPAVLCDNEFAGIYVRENGDLFRFNRITRRMTPAYGIPDGPGAIAWDRA